MPWQVYNSAGQLLQATDLPDNAVTNAKVADDAIDSAEIATGAIDTAHIAGSQITNALMADDAIGVAELSATGTASSSTFLRGDNAWAAAGVSVFYGEFTKNTADATDTTTVISGVGFTVKALIVFYAQHNATGRAGWGMATSADQGALTDVENEAAGVYYIPGTIEANHVIASHQTASNYYSGQVTTFGGDGFTVTWRKDGSSSGTLTVMYMAIG